MTSGGVDWLPASRELSGALDRLRLLGFRPVPLSWIGGHDNGLVGYVGGVVYVLELRVNGFSAVTRGVVVDDRFAPSHLLDGVRTVFEGGLVEAAECLLSLVESPTAPINRREVG